MRTRRVLKQRLQIAPASVLLHKAFARAASVQTMLRAASRSRAAFARAFHSGKQRSFNSRSIAMGAETLDKTTPDSKWKELLSAEEVCTFVADMKRFLTLMEHQMQACCIGSVAAGADVTHHSC